MSLTMLGIGSPVTSVVRDLPSGATWTPTSRTTWVSNLTNVLPVRKLSRHPQGWRLTPWSTQERDRSSVIPATQRLKTVLSWRLTWWRNTSTYIATSVPTARSNTTDWSCWGTTRCPTQARLLTSVPPVAKASDGKTSSGSTSFYTALKKTSTGSRVRFVARDSLRITTSRLISRVTTASPVQWSPPSPLRHLHLSLSFPSHQHSPPSLGQDYHGQPTDFSQQFYTTHDYFIDTLIQINEIIT